MLKYTNTGLVVAINTKINELALKIKENACFWRLFGILGVMTSSGRPHIFKNYKKWVN